MLAIRNYKLVLVGNVYDTDITNSIFEIRLALYCPSLEKMKSSFLTTVYYLSLRVLTLLILM